MKTANFMMGVASTASTVLALDYPATMEIDLVFPRNGTYNNATEIPVVFAFQNAEALFQWGYTLTWEMATVSSDESSPAASGILYEYPPLRSAPADAINNIWIGASSNKTALAAGQYELSWEWSTVACDVSGDQVQYELDGQPISGTMSFTLVGDGSGDDVDLAGECPVYQDRVVMTGVLDDGCPVTGSEDQIAGKPDACKAKLSKDMAACVMANLTDSGDNSACQKLTAKGGSSNDDDDDENEKKDSEDDEGGASAVSGSLSLLTLTAVMGFAFLY